MILLIGLLGVLAAAALWVAFRWAAPTIARHAIAAGLQRTGLPKLDFEVDRVAWGVLQLSGIRLESGELAADALIARWSLADLRRGGVDEIEVRGPTLRGRRENGGVSFGALDPWLLASDDADAAAPVVPANRILLRDASVWLDHADAPQRLLADAELRLRPVPAGHAQLHWHVRDQTAGSGSLRIEQDGRAHLELELRAPWSALASWWPEQGARRPDVPDARFDATLSADGSVGSEGALLDRFELSLPAHALLGRPGRLRADGRARAERPAPDAGLALEADFLLEAELAGTAAQSGIHARGPVHARWQGETLHVALPACLEVALAPGPLSAALHLERHASLCVRTPDDASAATVRLDGNVPRYRAPLRLSSPELLLRSPADADGEPFRVSGRALELRLDLSGTGDAAPQVAFRLRGERVDLPSSRLHLHDLVLDGGFRPDAAPPFQGRFELGALRDTDHPTRFPPLAGSGSIELDAARVGFEARARDDTGSLRARITGEHLIPSGVGHARITSEPMLFGEGHGTAKALARWLGPEVAVEAGSLGAVLHLEWNPQRWDARADFDVDGADLSVFGVRVDGLDATLSLRELSPAATDGVQELQFRSAHPGLDLGAGRIRYDVGADGVVHIRESRIELAGGRIEISGVLDLAGGPQQRIDFRAVDVDLLQLLRLVPVAGLSASGNLSGEMQLGVAEGRPVLRGGVFRVMEGGRIQYRPGEVAGEAAEPRPVSPDDPAGVVREIMRDFHYETLNLSVAGWLDERASAQVQLRGYNPAFQDGHPVSLTINVSTGFAEAVESLPELRALFRHFAGAPKTDLQTPVPRP